MRSFQVIGFLLLFGSVANGGIAYQWTVDGAGTAVNIAAGGVGSWTPIIGGSPEWTGSGDSTSLYVVDDSLSATHRIDASVSSSRLTTVSGLIQAANLSASDGINLFLNGTGATGYNEGSTNYFGWAAYSTSSGDSLLALGWASFKYTPDLSDSPAGGGFNSGDAFTILDWAYTTDATDSVSGNASFAAGITAGTTADDQGSPSPSGVPEPMGLAILGLAGLTVAASRRHRR